MFRRKNQPGSFASSSGDAFSADQVPQRWLGGLESQGLSGRALPRRLFPLHSKSSSALRVKRAMKDVGSAKNRRQFPDPIPANLRNTESQRGVRPRNPLS